MPLKLEIGNYFVILNSSSKIEKTNNVNNNSKQPLEVMYNASAVWGWVLGAQLSKHALLSTQSSVIDFPPQEEILDFVSQNLSRHVFENIPMYSVVVYY